MLKKKLLDYLHFLKILYPCIRVNKNYKNRRNIFKKKNVAVKEQEMEA